MKSLAESLFDNETSQMTIESLFDKDLVSKQNVDTLYNMFGNYKLELSCGRRFTTYFDQKKLTELCKKLKCPKINRGSSIPEKLAALVLTNTWEFPSHIFIKDFNDYRGNFREEGKWYCSEVVSDGTRHYSFVIPSSQTDTLCNLLYKNEVLDNEYDDDDWKLRVSILGTDRPDGTRQYNIEIEIDLIPDRAYDVLDVEVEHSF